MTIKKTTRPRKSKFDEWEPDLAILKKLEDWSAIGTNQNTIATNLGMSVPTFRNMREKFPKMDIALQLGRDRDINEMENILRFLCTDSSGRGQLPAIKYYMGVKHHWAESSNVNVTTDKKVDKLEFTPFKNDKD